MSRTEVSIYIINLPKARPRFVNQSEFLGFALEEFADLGTVLSAIHPDDREAARNFRDRVLAEDGAVVDYRICSKNGEWVWVRQREYILEKDAAGEALALLGTLEAITSSKQAESVFYRSEARYRKFFEEDLTGDYIATPEGNLVACNPAFAKIFGFASVEAAMQYKLSELFPSAEAYSRFLQVLYREKRLEYHEAMLRRPDGKIVHIIENVIGTFNPQGDLIVLKGYMFDNTEQVRLAERFRQAQKMESIGSLAGNIAHNFNNLLGIIQGYAAMLEAQPGDAKKVLHCAAAINRAGQRGAGLVRQILTFARKAAVKFESIQINTLLQDLAQMLFETFPRTIEIKLRLAPELPLIIADQNQLHQALLNICVNARHAMPEGGTLIISSRRVPCTLLREKHFDACAEDYVCLSIQDTGTGMDEETRSQIFEPFFTTKEPNEGTGLGLSVVYGVVKAHQGHIEVTSEPGKGTCFYLYLPVSGEASSEAASISETDESIAGGSESILVVEDEELLLELLTNMLRRQGYRVYTARDGQEAIEKFIALQDKIDLVLTDMGLPRLNGREVFRQIKSIKADVNVMLATGYLDPNLKFEMLRAGAREFIHKPYVPNEVLKKIRMVLDESAVVNKGSSQKPAQK